MEEVARDVYAYIQPDGSWWINNTGFIVSDGDSGIIAIDSCSTETRTLAYQAAIATVSQAGVSALVNTHHHGDHTNGNYLFRGAAVVGHHNCRADVLATGLPSERTAQTWEVPDWGALELCPPFVTFDHRLDMWTGDFRCEVRFVGTPAHTTSDSVVWLPEQSVLFAGDLLFKGGTPFILGGSLSGAITAITELATLKPKIVVPGHGPICGPEVLGEVLGYLRFVSELAATGVEADISPLDAARETDLGEYGELLDRERIVANLHRAYAELRGTRPGGPINRPSALADMVVYNGGRRLKCHA